MSMMVTRMYGEALPSAISQWQKSIYTQRVIYTYGATIGYIQRLLIDLSTLEPQGSFTWTWKQSHTVWRKKIQINQACG
jgi:hypothetical protein